MQDTLERPNRLLSDHQKTELLAFCQAVTGHKDILAPTIWIFGSAARGRTFPFSDVDVAVGSQSFELVPWAHRIRMLKDLCSAGSPISPIGVTMAEVARGERAYPSVLRSLTEGRRKLASELLS